jgi:N-acyl-D-aspartate/D-glutamate deacylase
MLERLRNPIMQQRVYQDFANGITGWENQVGSIGWERVYIAGVQQEQHRMLEGLNIAEIADRFGQSPEQAFFHLLLEEQGQITVTLFLMDEQDVDQVVQSAFSMLGSDGLPIASGRPHPRLYGTFPRYIRRYVRELKYMSLEQAIHKITAFPAARFGLADRGEIAIGKIADLVLFDPDGISDEATYNNPRIYPQGIAAVIVAGQPVVLNKQLQAPLPGRLLTSVHPD